MNFSIFLTTLQSNYQFITFLLTVMDLHPNSVLQREYSVQSFWCSTYSLCDFSVIKSITLQFSKRVISFSSSSQGDRYLQTSFELREAWTCLLVNRCPLANSHRSYRSWSRDWWPRTCCPTHMHIWMEQSRLHPSTSSSRHHVIPTSRTCHHCERALNDSTVFNKLLTVSKFNTSTFTVSSTESRLTITVIGVPFIFRNTDTTVLAGKASFSYRDWEEWHLN